MMRTPGHSNPGTDGRIQDCGCEKATQDLSREVIGLRFIDTLEALMQGSAAKGKDSKDTPPDLTVTVP